VGPAPVLALAAVVAGVLAGERAGAAPGALVVIGVGALFAAWFARGGFRAVLAVAACAVLAFAASARATDGMQHSGLEPATAARGDVTLVGTLTGDPSGGPYAASVLVRVGVPGGGHRTVLAEASGDNAMRLRVLEAGDRVVLLGRLGALGHQGSAARARGRHAVARLGRTVVAAVAPPTGLAALAAPMRAVVLRGTRPLPPDIRALVAGFLLGDTRGIPAGTVADYRAAGLSHLLAVSGANVAFVLALAGPVLRRLRVVPRTALAVAVVAVFAAMTRFEPSVLRASAMAVLALLAALAGRPAARGRVLAIAAVVLLVADPFLLRSIGFLLSCAAAAGIAFCEPPIARRLPGPRLVREPLAVSLAAQAGVTPVLLVVFGSFPLVTPLANVAAAPAADLLGVYGFVASGATGLVPGLGPLLQAPTALLAGWVTSVARVGASVPLTINRRGALAIVAVGAGIASLACVRARSRPAVSDAARR
jgi:competence protein ComEC